MKRAKKLAVMLCVMAIVMVTTSIVALADAAEPTSLLDAGTKAVVEDFAADIVPTVMELIGVLVPVGLTLWGIGFAVKKGISFLQRRAKSSL